MAKKQYLPPVVEARGSMTATTKGASSGARLDASFPVGTPFGDLTFS